MHTFIFFNEKAHTKEYKIGSRKTLGDYFSAFSRSYTLKLHPKEHNMHKYYLKIMKFKDMIQIIHIF